MVRASFLRAIQVHDRPTCDFESSLKLSEKTDAFIKVGFSNPRKVSRNPRLMVRGLRAGDFERR
jgi:hypothetical protein